MIRMNDAMVNALAGDIGMRRAIGNAKLEFYTGAQPATADDAASGTLLVTFTKAGGAYTAETLPEWKITLGGAAGSVDTVKIGGASGVNLLAAAVAFTTDLATTAIALAAAITNNLTVPDCTAYASGNDVFVVGPVGAGATMNGLTVVTTVTTMTATVANAGAPQTNGVTAVNGLNFAFPAASGVLQKESSVWQGTAVATGTAGWFRFTAGTRVLDGSIATSGGDINGSVLSITSGGVQTLNTFPLTIPKS